MKKIELDISPDFTLEDIRKIRDYHYEMTKNMTREERDAYYDERCKKAMERFHSSSKKYVLESETTSVAAEPEFEYKTQKKPSMT